MQEKHSTRHMFANWKMGGNIEYLHEVISKLKSLYAEKVLRYSNQVVLLLPSPLLALCYEKLVSYGLEKSVAIGAQQVDLTQKVTGEVDCRLLKDVGCRYVCVGHSERREACGETDDTIEKMVYEVFNHGMTPIVCVGESKADRAAGFSERVVRRQLSFLEKKHFDIKGEGGIIVAYEPVWSIGASEAAGLDVVVNMFDMIKSYGQERSPGTDISMVYGGSVDKSVCDDMGKIKELYGFLVGRSSLNMVEFEAMIRSCA